jgi:hypothetical protein
VIQLLVVSSALFAVRASDPHDSGNDPRTASKVAANVNPVEALAKYNALKEKTPATAAAQWKLGLWCEQHALKPEANVHFWEVVRLDPN